MTTNPPEAEHPSRAAPARRSPARGRGRPKGGRHLVDREAMLDAAERVIGRTGHGASLEAIALEAGVTKPIVYARVGGRAELSNELAARLSSRLIARAGAELAGSALDRAALATFFRVTLETIAADRELFLYVTRGVADDTAERALFLAGRSARPLAVFLSRWREGQGADASVATPWSYAIIGMLNLVSLWWLAEDERPVAELADHLADLTWSGMRGDR